MFAVEFTMNPYYGHADQGCNYPEFITQEPGLFTFQGNYWHYDVMRQPHMVLISFERCPPNQDKLYLLKLKDEEGHYSRFYQSWDELLHLREEPTLIKNYIDMHRISYYQG